MTTSSRLGALAVIGTLSLLFPPTAVDASDAALLTRLGGTYGGKYVLDQRLVEGEVVIDGPAVDTVGGRLVLPRRKGQKIRGTISLGLGLLDFRQRVRQIRCRRNSAVYKGPLILTIRDSDQSPLVGRFTARARTIGNRERANLRFNTRRVESEDPLQYLVLRGKFSATR